MQKEFPLKRLSRFLPVVILAACFVTLFYHPLRELLLDWTIDPNYQHGFLIPVISAFCIWQKRKEVRSLSLQPTFGGGMALLCLSMLLYVLGTAAAEWFISRLAMLLCLIGLVICFGGRSLFKVIWFPILYLIFMIPLPYVVYYRFSFPLQQAASFGAFHTLGMLGIAGLKEGNILHFPGYSLEVIEACSGLRSMMVLMALAGLVAYSAQLSNTLRWLLFFAAVPIAVIANIARLLIVATIGVFHSAEAAESFLHEASGILVFLCGLFLLTGLAGILKWFNSRGASGLSLA
jgi:exosortase